MVQHPAWACGTSRFAKGALLAAGLLGMPLSAQAAAGPPPARIVVFPFELTDFSAGAGLPYMPGADQKYLRDATRAAWQALSRSGHYKPIEASGAALAAAGLGAGIERRLHENDLAGCDGCDAAIARALGADQSFLGSITRISRTEYVIRFVIRDARTGRLVRASRGGLRIGADYSWARGVRAALSPIFDPARP